MTTAKAVTLCAAARARPYAALAIAAAAALGVYVLVRRPEDWHKVYVAAARALWAGDNPYTLGVGFVYPPAAILLALPAAFVPDIVARLIYVVLNIGALLAFWWSAWRLGGGQPGRQPDWREHAVLAAGMLVGLRFVTDVLEHQQTDLIVASLITVCGWLVVQGRLTAAALCCGLAAALKATPLVGLAYFVICGRWQAAAVMLATITATSVVPDFIARAPDDLPWIGYWFEWFVLPQLSGAQLGRWHTAPEFNQALAGTLYRNVALEWPDLSIGFFTVLRSEQARVLSPSALVVMIQAVQLSVAAIGFGAIIWHRWVARATVRRHAVMAAMPPAEGLEFAILLLLMVLISPASSKPHFLVTLLPAFCLARRALGAHDLLSAACLAAAIAGMVLSNRSWLGPQIGNSLQWAGAIGWSALALLIGCAAALAARGREHGATLAPSPVAGGDGGTRTPPPVLFGASGKEKEERIRA